MTGWKIKEVILLSDEWSEAFTAQFVKRRKRLLSRSKRPHLNSIEIVTRPRLLWRYQANMVPMGCQSFHQGLRILLCVGCSNLNHDLSLHRDCHAPPTVVALPGEHGTHGLSKFSPGIAHPALCGLQQLEP